MRISIRISHNLVQSVTDYREVPSWGHSQHLIVGEKLDEVAYVQEDQNETWHY